MDFACAFDAVDYEYFNAVLQWMNSDERVIQFLQILFCNAKSQNYNSGYAPQSLAIRRSVCQGCALSTDVICSKCETIFVYFKQF